ncbi:MAG: amino-acid N-acetyltransferase [Gammaproteobacteria bacterium RIFCSPLOWO2_02_FULL_56_15]|nr:MAG: amino-acid N-acetyltransferase [Gammaproteobacteria bacterium RIFCSPLOWO2_02_FULL_56_15]
MVTETLQFAEWFRSTTPYIRIHRGKTFVIQFDDDAVASVNFTSLVHDLALLNSIGIRLVLVYGSRHCIEHRLQDRKLTLHYHNGLRVTTAEAMECVKESVGQLGIEIAARLSMGLGNTPMSNARLRVSSGNFIIAKPLGVIDGVDYQYTGEIRRIDVDAINERLKSQEIILVPPLGYSITGEIFNLSASELAARLAVSLQADKLIYLLEAEGMCNGQGKLIREMTWQDAESVLWSSGNTDNDQYRYFRAAIEAARHGVDRVHLVDRRRDGALLHELFTRDGAGTMISSMPYDLVRKAEVDDIGGLLELIMPLEQQGILVERSREKLELEIEHFTLMERDGVIIGCVALYPFPDGNGAELACLAVHPDYHRSGRGEQLLSQLENEAGAVGIQRLFILTTHAEHWFLERGFVHADLDDLPVERKTLYNYQRNSKVLVKQLSG